jgi:hypothetical protein
MDRFLADAENILETSVRVARHGEKPTNMVILIGVQNQIRMLADCDWPLDSIRNESGARSAYRVTARANAVIVEGAEGGRTCRLEQTIPLPFIPGRQGRPLYPAAKGAHLYIDALTARTLIA